MKLVAPATVLATITVLLCLYPAVSTAQDPTPVDCKSYTSCTTCVPEEGCSWCASDGKCRTTDSGCISACQKTQDPADCPAIPICRTQVTCRDCVSKGCGWCGTTGKCDEAGPAGPPGTLPFSCAGDDSCGDNGGMCFHGPAKNGGHSQFCPSVSSCKIFTGCKNCTEAGCGWCGATGTCSEVQTDGKATCDGTTCAKCFNTDPESCPANGACSSHQSCRSCAADAGCGWCAESQSCLAVGADKVPCSGASKCKDGCLKTEAATCPTEATCGILNSCSSCIAANCDWCAMTETCIEPSTTNTTSCQACDGPDACTKKTASVCPSVPSCPGLTDCKTCSEAGCSWCASAQKCVEMSTRKSDSTFCHGNRLGGCTPDMCLKGEGQSDLCPGGGVDYCKQFTTCRTCIPEKNCGWDPMFRKCVEANIKDTNGCSNHTTTTYFAYDNCNDDCVYPQQQRSKESCIADPNGCGFCEGAKMMPGATLPLGPLSPKYPDSLCLEAVDGKPFQGFNCTNFILPNPVSPSAQPSPSNSPQPSPPPGVVVFAKPTAQGDTAFFVVDNDESKKEATTAEYFVIDENGPTEETKYNTGLDKSGEGFRIIALKNPMEYNHDAGTPIRAVYPTSDKGGKKGLGGGAIAAIIFGVLVAIGIVGGAVWYLMKKNEGSTLGDPMMGGEDTSYAQIQ